VSAGSAISFIGDMTANIPKMAFLSLLKPIRHVSSLHPSAWPEVDFAKCSQSDCADLAKERLNEVSSAQKNVD
jgi:hypothetical protein